MTRRQRFPIPRRPVIRVATVGVAGLMAVGAVVPAARRLTGPKPVRRRRATRWQVATAAVVPQSDAPSAISVRWPQLAAAATDV